MLLRENASEEKLKGRYYTQRELAMYITSWVVNNNDIKIQKVLEPSCGDGIFLECIDELGLKDTCEIISLEIDRVEAIKASNRVKDSMLFEDYDKYNFYRANTNIECLKYEKGIKVICDDFYKVYQECLSKSKFQAIVGNPPYIRYQYLNELQREEQSLILTNNGMKSNKLINAWVSFVVACTHMMDENSRMGLVIPAELLQVKYAEALRKFLMSSLQKITIITFEELVFEGVEQEVVLLLGEKDINHNQNHKLRIVQYANVKELIEGRDLEQHEFFDADLNESKWTKYFLKESDIELIDNVRNDSRFVQFNKMAKIEVGITTGNNDYFCINRNQVEQYSLGKVCRPLIARSVNINGIIFTRQDWLENVQMGTKTYLIDFPNIDFNDYDEKHKEYIKLGEDTDQNVGYKCKIRDRWYIVPSVRVSDGFFLRRNYLYPKFILNSNEINAVSTDTMHRVTFKDKKVSKRILLSYYNSIGLAFTEIEGRSYGGGVLEILPSEVGSIILPDLRCDNLIDDKTVDELIKLIDTYVRSNNDILGILDEIDKKVLVEILGLSMDMVLQFREIWINLRSRRLNRGKS